MNSTLRICLAAALMTATAIPPAFADQFRSRARGVQFDNGARAAQSGGGGRGANGAAGRQRAATADGDGNVDGVPPGRHRHRMSAPA